LGVLHIQTDVKKGIDQKLNELEILIDLVCNWAQYKNLDVTKIFWLYYTIYVQTKKLDFSLYFEIGVGFRNSSLCSRPIYCVIEPKKFSFLGNELVVKSSKSDDSLQLTIAEDEEEEEEENEDNEKEQGNIWEDDNLEEEIKEKVGDEDEADLQSTSKRLPLTSLLPMVREEFREHLEGMFKAIKKKQNLSLEEAINSMQNLLDSIFDAVC